MDSTRTKSKPNPREKANIISVLLWWWTIGLFKTGYQKVLGTEDLFDPLQVDRSNLLGDRLEKRWKIELENAKKRKRKPSLLRTIFRTFLWEYSMLGLVQILNEFVIRVGTPLILGGLLRYFRKDSVETYETALWYAAGICIATCVNVISGNQTIFGAFHVGAKVRVAVCSVVYRKALRLSKTALGETAPGKVVNLVANDVNRFDLVTIFIHHMWSAPLSAMLIAYILYCEIGYPGLIGIAAVFVVVPIQSYTGKLSSKFRLQTAIKTDERVRLMDEIISGVQVIKMYAWEKPFCALVELARKLELRVVTKSSYIRGVYMTFNLFTTRMALYCTLISMLMFGNELSADKVFVFSSYFNILAHTMSGMFVRGFAELAECMVAIRRLQRFLMHDEFESSDISNKFSNSYNGSINTESRQTSNKASRQDLPYIDDDVGNYEILDDTSDWKKHNGLVIVASDLVKNTANLITEKKQLSMHNDDNWAIKMVNITAKWEPRHTENTLEDLNLKIEKGKLYAVIGMVGSGKSSFLSAILGEIHLMEGHVQVNGDISYASQEAWVFGSSVRQNILFGQAYDRKRYQKVINACALLRDFKQFPEGDQTIVGERGSSLSGGQKARINLARSLYRQADIYLLDDPLSAVDAHVSKHLFQECIQRYLAGKTRILATHQLQYIESADGIILLEQGKIKYFSHYHDLLDYRPEYGELLATKNQVNDDSSIEKSMKRQFSTSSTRSRTPDISSGGTDDEDEDENAEKLNSGLESTSRGIVKGPIFIKYFQTGANIFMASIVLFMFFITQFIVSLNDYFVPILLNAEETRHYLAKVQNNNITDDLANATSTETDMLSENTYIYIYTGIVLGIFFVGITRSLFFYKTCMMCSQRLHDLMFGALIRTGMRFFDTNPSGRILNRFSKDMGAIDELLPKAMLDAGQMNMTMLGALIVTCVVNPVFLVPIAFIGAIFYWIRKVYLKTSKNIKRLEGITRSPVFTHLNATLNGLTTIRAYRAQDILKGEFDKLQDTHTSTVYMYIVTSTAFGFSLDVFCFIFTSLVTFSFLLLNDSFSGGEVGLAITQVMAMTGIIQWGMRQSAEVANQMMAVERVLEYVQLPPEQNLPERRASLKKDKQSLALPVNVSMTWPDKGYIKFKNVYMRYAEEDPMPVLKNLNLVIQAGEKIGIVGRTGAGKSSLISALFRLAKVEGIIEIDGVNTGSIPLENLRSKISIIPQDPVLFSGTLRRNLDPFDEFSDVDVWGALEEVELKDAVVTAGNGLETRVFDRGSNFSVGQRQLVCLARAILRNNRILMLDEATANVDPHTDALIQRTIRKKFATCTMLTVAHRLNTIMDSDKVLVMDKGHMVEYDHPHILLQNSSSQFTRLAKEAGRGMYDQLAKVANQSYKTKYEET